MQIKTALAIGSGIAIGVIFGMGVSEDTKCKVLGKIRNKLIYMLGGEVKKNPATRSHPTYYTTYKESNPFERRDIPDKKLTLFKTEEEAQKCFDEMIKLTEAFKTCSVHDLAKIRGKSLDYTWDNYGWDNVSLSFAEIDEVIGDDPLQEDNEEQYKLVLPKPKLLRAA